MGDFSNLVGMTFRENYSDVDINVHAAFVHDGQLRVVVSREGGPLYETNVETLREKKCPHQ